MAEKQTSATLADRITEALTAPQGSAGLEALVADVKADKLVLAVRAGEAERRALDPLAGRADVSAAKCEMDAHAFQGKRLTAALGRLEERLAETRAGERETGRREAYEAAGAERDAVADELRTLYPRLAGDLAALLARIQASDAAVGQANRDRPAGRSSLDTVEAVVRGIQPYDTGVGTLAQAVKLPALEREAAVFGPSCNPFWPPMGRPGSATARGLAVVETRPAGVRSPGGSTAQVA